MHQKHLINIEYFPKISYCVDINWHP